MELFFLKRLVVIVEVVSKLMQRWKKSCSGGKIKLKEEKAKVKIYKILAWSG